ncbi:GlyGly-CTERM sorting domain-containing protein [Polaribacter atrinae]
MTLQPLKKSMNFLSIFMLPLFLFYRCKKLLNY